MKFLIIFMIISSVQLSASVYSQQKKFTFSMHNVHIKKVLSEIRKESTYDFIYQDKDINKISNLDIVVKDATLNEILDMCVANTDIMYSVEGKIILLKKDVPKSKCEMAKGIVKDEKGKPLPGVSIVIKGTKVGVSSDVNGRFEIKVDKGDTLVFSFVGMKLKEVKYEGKELNITMEEDKKQLDEVVVSTGYQKIERRHLTSAVTTLKKEDVVEPGVISVDKLLSYKVPGLIVMNESDTPGAAPKLRIRGENSITGNREPVWVVDGFILQDPVQISNEELNSLDRVNFVGNAISFLNPEDIEQIDILKDASATAIYGPKAANGVIVITTKRGEKGKPSVSYSVSASFKQRPDYKLMHRMNSKDRMEVSEEMHRRGLYFSNDSPLSVGYEGALNKYWNKEITYEEFNKEVKYLKELNTDWYDLLFRDVLNTTHSLSISGGGDNSTYYLSLGYANQNGLVLGENYGRYNANVNISYKLSKNINISTGLNLGMTDNKRNHQSVNAYGYAFNTARTVPAYNPDGSYCFYTQSLTRRYPGYNEIPIKYNILNEMDNSEQRIKNNNTNINTSINWRIIKNLNLTTAFSYANSSSDNESWANEDTYYIQKLRQWPKGVPFPEGDRVDYGNASGYCQYGGEYKVDYQKNESWTARFNATYSKGFDKNNISITFGTEFNSSRYSGHSLTEWGYLPDRGKKFVKYEPNQFLNHTKQVLNNPVDIKDNKTNVMSYYATFTYAWDNKYIFNTNVRADASNKFGQDDDAKFLPIWSVSGRWNMMKEKFIDNLNLFDGLSLRASYGLQGNVHQDQCPNLLLQMGNMDAKTGYYISSLSKFPNQHLKWEKTESYNVGLDISMFKRLFHASIEGYWKKGTDMVVTRDITSTNGTKSFALNEGKLNNRGLELSLGTTIINTKDIDLNMNFNTSKNWNEVKDSGKGLNITYNNYLNGTVVKDGKSLNTFYAYRYKSLDDKGAPTFYNTTGKDKDGNYIVKNYEEACEYAMKEMGRRMPNVQGGLGLNFRYKKITLTTMFTVSLGATVRLNNLYEGEQPRLAPPVKNMDEDYTKRWRKPGDEKLTDYPALVSYANTICVGEYPNQFNVLRNPYFMWDNSDLRCVKNNYLKCRNLNLSYRFNNSFVERLKLKALSFTCSISNLFTIANSKLKGRDPEQINISSGAVPPQRTFTLNLRVTF